jgi:hypothetical protein
MLSKVIDYIRNRTYMGGVEREQTRVKATGEVFTPTLLVQEILDQLPTELFTDSTKTYLDPSCGDGQFLGEVLIRKMENGATFEEALSTIYGVDLMQDNVDLCRERLLCGREDLRPIVEQNIYCADALKFDYKFNQMDKKRKLKEERRRKKETKAKEKRLKEEKKKLREKELTATLKKLGVIINKITSAEPKKPKEKLKPNLSVFTGEGLENEIKTSKPKKFQRPGTKRKDKTIVAPQVQSNT